MPEQNVWSGASRALMAVAAVAALGLNGCVTALVGATAAGTGAVIGSDSRTVDVMVDDEVVEQKAWDIIHSYTGTDNTARDIYSLSVYSVNGQVLLVGQTRQQSVVQAIIERMKSIKHVRNIYNYVENTDPVSAGVVAADSLITSKAKTKLLFGRQINSGRFKIVTENSNVYMMGFVTRDEANRAVNEVRQISGVHNIYTIFDLMNEIDPRGVNVRHGEIADPSFTDSAPAVSGGASSGRLSTAPNSSSLGVESQATRDNGGAAELGEEVDLTAPRGAGQPANW